MKYAVLRPNVIRYICLSVFLIEIIYLFKNKKENLVSDKQTWKTN